MKKFIAVIMMVIMFSMTVEASTGVIGKTWYSDDITAEDTGWLYTEHGTYYIHKTKSMKYDIGEACRNEYRWKDGKLYYFKNDGRVQTHNSRFIKLNEDDSVKYIRISGSNDRYNAVKQRYQRKINGTWHDISMQTNVWWMCDWQE